jgi:hypothetical protein
MSCLASAAASCAAVRPRNPRCGWNALHSSTRAAGQLAIVSLPIEHRQGGWGLAADAGVSRDAMPGWWGGQGERARGVLRVVLPLNVAVLGAARLRPTHAGEAAMCVRRLRTTLWGTPGLHPLGHLHLALCILRLSSSGPAPVSVAGDSTTAFLVTEPRRGVWPLAGIVRGEVESELGDTWYSQQAVYRVSLGNFVRPPRLPHRLSYCASLTVSPAVSPTLLKGRTRCGGVRRSCSSQG